MLYYDRTDVSEGSYVKKTSASKQCIVCHFWRFLDKGFKFQPAVCNGCHGALMVFIDLNIITMLNIHGVDYQSRIN